MFEIDLDLTASDHSTEHEYNRSTDSDTTGSIENDDFASRHLANKQHAKQHQSDEKLDRPTVKKQQRAINKSGQNEANEVTPNLAGQCTQSDTKTTRSTQLINLKQSPSDTSLNNQLDQTEYVYVPEEQKFGDEYSQTDDENKSLLWSLGSLLKQVWLFYFSFNSSLFS